MKAVVVGGAGFIGSHLVDRLVEDGHDVLVLDNLSSGNMRNVNKKAQFYQLDIALVPVSALTAAFRGAEVVFHLAARARVQPSLEYPVAYHEVNVTGTLHCLQAARLAGVQRFVFSSSSSVYGMQSVEKPLDESTDPNPASPYAVQKLMGEQYCEMYSMLYGLKTVALRYFNVYGERMQPDGAYAMAIPTFLRQRRAGQPLTIYNTGNQRRDFTYVGDVVEANLLAATVDGNSGLVFNIGSGTNVSVNELADIVGGERIHAGHRLEPYFTLADNTLARELLGWEPTMDVKTWLKAQV
jgi:nucleoside-diphosphate-sugar epimerase